MGEESGLPWVCDILSLYNGMINADLVSRGTILIDSKCMCQLEWQIGGH